MKYVASLCLSVEELIFRGIVQIFYFLVMFPFEMQVKGRKAEIFLPTLTFIEDIFFTIPEIGIFFPMSLSLWNQIFLSFHQIIVII